MKKTTILFTAIAALALFVSMPANAEPSVYVGSDYQYTQQREVVSGEDSFNGLSLNAGSRLSENLGIEASVAKTLAEDTAGTRVDITSFAGDGIFYFPVVQNVDLLATGGIVYHTVEAKAVSNDSELGWTVGTGAQFALNDKLSVRGLAKYDDTNLDAIGSDGAFKYTVGFQHKF